MPRIPVTSFTNGPSGPHVASSGDFHVPRECFSLFHALWDCHLFSGFPHRVLQLNAHRASFMGCLSRAGTGASGRGHHQQGLHAVITLR